MSELLGADLLILLKAGYNCDMIVVCEGGTELKVHKFILAARSRVFRTMLDVDMVERESGTAEIKDFASEVVTEFINFLYSGQISGDFTNFTELLQIGHQYEVHSLVKTCSDLLVFDISAKNVAEIGALAEKYDLTDLTEACTQFLAENIEDLEPEHLATLPSSLTWWKSCKSSFASIKTSTQLLPVKVDVVKTTYMVNLYTDLGEPEVVQEKSSIHTVLSVSRSMKLAGVGLYLSKGKIQVTLTINSELMSPVTVIKSVRSHDSKIPVKILFPNPLQLEGRIFGFSTHDHYKLSVKFGKACYYLKGTEKSNTEFCMENRALKIFTHDDCQISVLYFEE